VAAAARRGSPVRWWRLGVATVKVECGSIVGAHPSSRGGKYAGFTLPVREKTEGSR